MTTQTNQSTKDIIYELAKGVFAQKSSVTYSKMRVRLNKQGFSEIALFSAAARHCEENSIKPTSYVSDMIKLIEGCGRDLFFPKTHNDYHYLRGQFHDIRHGNLERGESKSPEQRGLFLCNMCYLIKSKNERSKSANDKHTCIDCRSKKSKKYYENKKTNKEGNIKEGLLECAEVKENNVETKTNTSNENLPENNESREKNMCDKKEVVQEKKSFAQLLGSKSESGAQIELTEVIADAKGATITINCPTANLHLVLSSLSEFTG